MKNSQSSVERFLSAAARVLALSSATAAASLSGSAFADEIYVQNDNSTSDIALTGDTTFSLNYSTGRTATQSGVLSGAGHLFVDGSGTTANQNGGVLLFTAANSFTGDLTISNATLRLSGSNAKIGDASHIYSGVITLGSPVSGTTATLDFNQTPDLELRGKIVGEGNIVISGGASISFRNTSGSTYSGTTTITNGILRTETTYDNTFSANSSLVLNAATGATATINLAGTTQTVAALTLANGTINGGSDGKLNVIGALTVANGSINFGSNGELNARGGLSGNVAAGAINFGNSGKLNVTQTADATYSGTLSGDATSTFKKDGAATLTLSGNLTAYAGSIEIAAGSLAIASDTNLGTGTNTLDDSTLILTGANNTVYSKSWNIGTNGGTIENAWNVKLSPAIVINTVTNPETGKTTTTTAPDPAGPFGKLTGTGAFTKAGNGILTLAAGASYAGNTTITAGTLEIAGPLGTTDGIGSSIYAGNIALDGGALTLNQETDQTLSGNIIQGKDTDGNLFANATVSKTGTGKLAFTGSTAKREFATFDNKLGETTVEGTFAATAIVNGTRDAREARSLDPAASFSANTVNAEIITNHADASLVATTITATTVINSGTLRAGTIKADVDNRANGDLYLGTQTAPSIEGNVTNAGTIHLGSQVAYTIEGNITNTGTVNFATGVPNQKLTIGYRASGTFNNSGAVRFNNVGQTLSAYNLSAPANSYRQYYNYTLDLTNSANNNHVEVVGGTVTGWHEFHILTPGNGFANVDNNFTYELIDLKDGATIDSSANIKTSPVYMGIYSLGVEGRGNATLRVLGFSPEGNFIFNALGSLSIGWFSQLDNLTQRQGELRTGLFAKETERNDDETGKAFEARRDKTARGERDLALWTRGYGFQANVDTGISGLAEFKEFQYGGDVGGDQLIDLNDDNKLFLGVFVGFQGSRRNIEDGAGTKSDTRSIAGGAYGTWVNKNGWYADVSIKGQSFSTEYKTIFDTKKTSFTTGGIGAAGELGKQFVIGERWFVEPSVQLAYSHLFHKAFRTRGSTGQENLNVSLDGSDILRIGGGLRVGVNLDLKEHGLIQPYLRIGVEYQTSDGGEVFVWRQTTSRSSASAITPDLDGTRVRGALGLSWQLSNAHSIHTEYETAYGDGYDIPWGINFGYRFRF